MNNASDFIIENGVLTRYTGPGGDVVIPEGVTSIGDRAFQACDAPERIPLPDSLTDLGSKRTNPFPGFLYIPPKSIGRS